MVPCGHYHGNLPHSAWCGISVRAELLAFGVQRHGCLHAPQLPLRLSQSHVQRDGNGAHGSGRKHGCARLSGHGYGQSAPRRLDGQEFRLWTGIWFSYVWLALQTTVNKPVRLLERQLVFCGL